jgi:hypothetical protein
MKNCKIIFPVYLLSDKHRLANCEFIIRKKLEKSLNSGG